MICDFDNMDLSVMEQKILEVKEMLAYLNDNYDDFPYNIYFQGSSVLQTAAAFVDDVILNGESD